MAAYEALSLLERSFVNSSVAILPFMLYNSVGYACYVTNGITQHFNTDEQ